MSSVSHECHGIKCILYICAFPSYLIIFCATSHIRTRSIQNNIQIKNLAFKITVHTTTELVPKWHEDFILLNRDLETKGCNEREKKLMFIPDKNDVISQVVRHFAPLHHSEQGHHLECFLLLFLFCFCHCFSLQTRPRESLKLKESLILRGISLPSPSHSNTHFMSVIVTYIYGGQGITTVPRNCQCEFLEKPRGPN